MQSVSNSIGIQTNGAQTFEAAVFLIKRWHRRRHDDLKDPAWDSWNKSPAIRTNSGNTTTNIKRPSIVFIGLQLYQETLASHGIRKADIAPRNLCLDIASFLMARLSLYNLVCSLSRNKFLFMYAAVMITSSLYLWTRFSLSLSVFFNSLI